MLTPKGLDLGVRQAPVTATQTTKSTRLWEQSQVYHLLQQERNSGGTWDVSGRGIRRGLL